MFIIEAQGTGTDGINGGAGELPKEVPGSVPMGGGGGGLGPPPVPPAAARGTSDLGTRDAVPPLNRTPTRKLLGDADDLPEDADTYEISRSNFRKRLERHSKTQLRQLFGTDNVEEVLQWKQQAEAAATREEESRLAQMTEAERYKSQMERYQSQAQHWRQQYEQLQETHAMREQDHKVGALVSRAVDPDCVDYVSLELAKHLNEVDETEIGQNPEAYVDGWVKSFVASHPKFALTNGGSNGHVENGVNGAVGMQPGAGGYSNAREFTPPGTQPTNGAAPQAGHQGMQGNRPRQVQIPIHNGPSTQRPSTNGTNPYTNKTVAPGQPNSYSEAELREFKRSSGYDW